MFNPVMAADGHSYEYLAILEWLEMGNLRGPMTGEILQNTNLTQNHRLRAIISSFKERLPEL